MQDVFGGVWAGNFRKTAFAAYVFPKGRQLERDGTQRPRKASPFSDHSICRCRAAQARARRATTDCGFGGPCVVLSGCIQTDFVLKAVARPSARHGFRQQGQSAATAYAASKRFQKERLLTNYWQQLSETVDKCLAPAGYVSDLLGRMQTLAA